MKLLSSIACFVPILISSTSYGELHTERMDRIDDLLQPVHVEKRSTKLGEILGKVGVKAVDMLLKNARKLHESDLATYYIKKGDYTQAQAEFQSVAPTIVYKKRNGVEGFIGDRHITVQKGSNVSFPQIVINKLNGEKKVIIMYTSD